MTWVAHVTNGSLDAIAVIKSQPVGRALDDARSRIRIEDRYASPCDGGAGWVEADGTSSSFAEVTYTVRVSRDLSEQAEARFWEGVAATEAFFMETDPVHAALLKLVTALDDLELPYAIAGAMALNEYGYRRATVDVGVLLTMESLKRFKEVWLGRGYVEKFAGSRGLRDTEHNVTIDVLVAGDYPGDGKPKPVRFPDPAEVAVRGKRVALLPIARMVELKLASGMTNIHRAKDLADVVELIKHVKLSRVLADEIDASVRPKYLEIWDALQTPDPMPE